MRRGAEAPRQIEMTVGSSFPSSHCAATAGCDVDVDMDADVDVHDTREVLFRLCANTDPGRDSLLSRGPADVLDHATSEIGSGTKMGFDATRKLAGEGFRREWPPVIRMDPRIKARVDSRSGS